MPDGFVYTREQLLSNHAYARPQIEAGYRLQRFGDYTAVNGITFAVG